MEKDFGIEEYVGGFQQPIPCILKELYTDFIVQEIGENQQVIPVRAPEVSEKEETVTYLPEVSAPVCISEQTVAELNDFVTNLKPKQKDNFLIDVKNLTKEERTSIHKFIRKRFDGSLSSELNDGNIVVSPNNTGRNDRKRKRWDPETPDYLHFTLAKENKDTSYALGILAKFIGVKPDLFRFCGIKDKRAVTSQRVSCYRVEKEKIINVLPRLRDFTVFDFEYKPEALKMGGHWGNRFSIILRNVSPDSKDVLTSRCELFKERGFLNYFGTQRFGSALNNTAETGKLIVQRKWEDAIKNIFRTSEEMGNTTVAEAASHFRKTGDAQAALKKLKGGQLYASIESNILRALAQGRTWQQCLTEVLPINMRSLYVHAYQSLLWNKILSRRIREYGCEVIPEDVAEMGGSVTDIFSVHIPLPGSHDSLFPIYAKTWLDELLYADNLSNDSFFSLRDRFALGDSTRPLLIRPDDVQYTLISYKQNKQVLQEGLVDHRDLEMDNKNEKIADELVGLQVQFNLPNGSYATVALRQITGFDMGKTNMKERGKQDEDGVVTDIPEGNSANAL